MLTLTLMSTTSCSQREKEDVLIVSIEPQRAILEEIVGDKYEVISLLTPGSNPETFEPGMNARKKLETAQAFFSTGLLPFEERIVESLADGYTVIDTSQGIELLYGTHGHSHDSDHKGPSAHGKHSHSRHTDADPHVWTSVKNAMIMAENMYNAITRIDTENVSYYTERYNRLIQRLDSLDRDFATRLGSNAAPVKSFAIWHPSLSYLSRDYNLEQIAVGYENKEMPASTLKKIIDEVRQDSVKVFFFQKEFDSRQAQTLNQEMQTELITINPLDYEWEKQLDGIVSALCR